MRGTNSLAPPGLTRNALQLSINHRLVVQSTGGRRKLTSCTRRVRGSLVVVRLVLVKGPVVNGEAKSLVATGAGSLPLAALLEPFLCLYLLDVLSLVPFPLGVTLTAAFPSLSPLFPLVFPLGVAFAVVSPGLVAEPPVAWAARALLS